MSKKELSEIFLNRLRFKSATGLDKIRPLEFEKKLVQYVVEILKKYNSQSYKFTPYKELLILKSTHKPPRLVSIPTVRDKLLLSWILKKVQIKLLVGNKFVYQIVEEIGNAINSGYVHFVKLDISGFYDNINHQLLIVEIEKKVKDKKVLDIIKKSNENPTTTSNNKPKQE